MDSFIKAVFFFLTLWSISALPIGEDSSTADNTTEYLPLPTFLCRFFNIGCNNEGNTSPDKYYQFQCQEAKLVKNGSEGSGSTYTFADPEIEKVWGATGMSESENSKKDTNNENPSVDVSEPHSEVQNVDSSSNTSPDLHVSDNAVDESEAQKDPQNQVHTEIDNIDPNSGSACGFSCDTTATPAPTDDQSPLTEYPASSSNTDDLITSLNEENNSNSITNAEVHQGQEQSNGFTDKDNNSNTAANASEVNADAHNDDSTPTPYTEMPPTEAPQGTEEVFDYATTTAIPVTATEQISTEVPLPTEGSVVCNSESTSEACKDYVTSDVTPHAHEEHTPREDEMATIPPTDNPQDTKVTESEVSTDPTSPDKPTPEPNDNSNTNDDSEVTSTQTPPSIEELSSPTQAPDTSNPSENSDIINTETPLTEQPQKTDFENSSTDPETDAGESTSIIDPSEKPAEYDSALIENDNGGSQNNVSDPSPVTEYNIETSTSPSDDCENFGHVPTCACDLNYEDQSTETLKQKCADLCANITRMAVQYCLCQKNLKQAQTDLMNLRNNQSLDTADQIDDKEEDNEILCQMIADFRKILQNCMQFHAAEIAKLEEINQELKCENDELREQFIQNSQNSKRSTSFDKDTIYPPACEILGPDTATFVNHPDHNVERREACNCGSCGRKLWRAKRFADDPTTDFDPEVSENFPEHNVEKREACNCKNCARKFRRSAFDDITTDFDPEILENLCDHNMEKREACNCGNCARRFRKAAFDGITTDFNPEILANFPDHNIEKREACNCKNCARRLRRAAFDCVSTDFYSELFETNPNHNMEKREACNCGNCARKFRREAFDDITTDFNPEILANLPDHNIEKREACNCKSCARRLRRAAFDCVSTDFDSELIETNPDNMEKREACNCGNCARKFRRAAFDGITTDFEPEMSENLPGHNLEKREACNCGNCARKFRRSAFDDVATAFDPEILENFPDHNMEKREACNCGNCARKFRRAAFDGITTDFEPEMSENLPGHNLEKREACNCGNCARKFRRSAFDDVATAFDPEILENLPDHNIEKREACNCGNCARKFRRAAFDGITTDFEPEISKNLPGHNLEKREACNCGSCARKFRRARETVS